MLPATRFAVERLGLPDNLIVPGAVLGGRYAIVLPGDGCDRAFDALEEFECCVALAMEALGSSSALALHEET